MRANSFIWITKGTRQYLFVISLFLSASLLFVIQPMVAKSLLPVYGGTPAVWTVCMLFFQGVLLFAYAYVWLLSRFNYPWLWRTVHLVMILGCILFAPVNFVSLASESAPDLSILSALIKQVGFPLAVIATSAPLLQFIYSKTSAKDASDPYFLYVASNLGSLLALLAYPWLIERDLGLGLQFDYWNKLLLGYLFILALMFFLLPLKQEADTHLRKQQIHQSLWRMWIAYSFIPCSLMLGVTFYLTTDIAAAPLFWVLPLALYLLSFIISFAKKPLLRLRILSSHSRWLILLPILGFIFGPGLPAWQLLLIHLSAFFFLSLICHGCLVQLRPPISQLPQFYFCLALGGLLAGIFNGLLAPHFFNGAYEYPLILLFTILFLPLSLKATLKIHDYWVPLLVLLILLLNYFLAEEAWFKVVRDLHILQVIALFLVILFSKTRIILVIGITFLFLSLLSSWFQPNIILTQQRNFYGVKQVLLQEGAHVLMSQNIVHGFQFLDKKNRSKADIVYYAPMSRVVSELKADNPVLRVSIVGLGTGLMACQFRQNDQVEMIDIDKQVIAMARDPELFTYLRDCPPIVSVRQGDGRMVLQTKKEAALDLLVIDAFSSDAIPAHLITQEAFNLYQQKLSANGVLLLHISNRHMRLLPVLAKAGQELDYMVLSRLDPAKPAAGQLASEWVLMTKNEILGSKLIQQGWRFAPFEEVALWTDDYANIIAALR